MKTPMVKTYCDFCLDTEISKSTPRLGGIISMIDNKDVAQAFDVEIRLSSTEPKKRFPFDICEDCLFKATDELRSVQASAEAREEPVGIVASEDTDV